MWGVIKMAEARVVYKRIYEDENTVVIGLKHVCPFCGSERYLTAHYDVETNTENRLCLDCFNGYDVRY